MLIAHTPKAIPTTTRFLFQMAILESIVSTSYEKQGNVEEGGDVHAKYH